MTTTTTSPRTLHVTSPLMSGSDVLEIQARLDELGYPVGAIDGAFAGSAAAILPSVIGPATPSTSSA